jgi:hypothetical protein
MQNCLGFRKARTAQRRITLLSVFQVRFSIPIPRFPFLVSAQLLSGLHGFVHDKMRTNAAKTYLTRPISPELQRSRRDSQSGTTKHVAWNYLGGMHKCFDPTVYERHKSTFFEIQYILYMFHCSFSCIPLVSCIRCCMNHVSPLYYYRVSPWL